MIHTVAKWLQRFAKKYQRGAMHAVKEEVIDPLLLPLHIRVQELYTRLNVPAFADYTREHGRNKTVTLVHKTIDVMVEDIYFHIQSLERGGYIQPQRVNYQAIDVPLNRFFLTKDFYYLPSIQGAVQHLVDVTIDLCKAVETAKHIVYETRDYNLRMLNSLLHVLYELGLTLTDISQEITPSR